MITEKFEELKVIFINLMAKGSYPYVGWNDFSAWCREVEILDNSIPTSTVDRMFIATKVGGRPGPSNTQLYRHEFLEILIRTANAKYRELGLGESYHECLKMMFD